MSTKTEEEAKKQAPIIILEAQEMLQNGAGEELKPLWENEQWVYDGLLLHIKNLGVDLINIITRVIHIFFGKDVVTLDLKRVF
jgi:hypothetical protein